LHAAEAGSLEGQLDLGDSQAVFQIGLETLEPLAEFFGGVIERLPVGRFPGSVLLVSQPPCEEADEMIADVDGVFEFLGTGGFEIDRLRKLDVIPQIDRRFRDRGVCRVVVGGVLKGGRLVIRRRSVAGRLCGRCCIAAASQPDSTLSVSSPSC